MTKTKESGIYADKLGKALEENLNAHLKGITPSRDVTEADKDLPLGNPQNFTPEELKKMGYNPDGSRIKS